MIAVLRKAIEQLLVTDAAFVAEMAALNFAATPAVAPTKTLRGWRDPRQIGQEHFPVWVFEPGDATYEEQGIGACHQRMTVEFLIGLVWHQQSHETAVDQRDSVVDAFVRLFLRNPCPGGIADTWVDSWANDRGANHPTHITTFRLLADLTINKD